MRPIDADNLDIAIYESFVFGRLMEFQNGEKTIDETSDLIVEDADEAIKEQLKAAPTIDAIPFDDNFGFAGYVVEKNELGIRVEETWNTDLTDEEMMYVMCGIIQDINEDERLKKLWTRATAMTESLGEEE